MCAACSYVDDLGRPGADPAGEFELIASSPTPGAAEVPRQEPIVLEFSAPPEATTAAAMRLRLFAGVVEYIVTIDVDLVAETITLTPTAPLRSNLRHKVLVHEDLRGLNGASLGERVVFDYTTGEDLGELPAPTPEPSTGQIQAIWDRHGCASCHGASHPPSGLDLSTASAALQSLHRHSAAFEGQPLIDPYHHARSYLMLKLLGEGGIVGYPMPPSGEELSAQDLRTVADWIDSGAGL